MRPVGIGALRIGFGAPLVFIGGPCVLESEAQAVEVARRLKLATAEAGLGFVFKSSFDKANRTSLSSYRGPGLARGLGWLARVRDEVGVAVTTDVHHPEQAQRVAEVVDLLQVPAFLCRQTDLIRACVDTGKPVNIKKGQFLSAAECAPLVQKAGGPGRILLTERGTTFGYNDLVADMRNIPRMQELGVPVVMDCTHAVQRPGLAGKASGGDRTLAPVLARAAVAAGADAVFAEVHPDPTHALSDAATQLPLNGISAFLCRLAAVAAAVRPGEA